MSYGRCVTCGAPGKVRERRPNGDTICENGHKHSSAAFDRHKGSAMAVQALSPEVDKLREYRSRLDPAVERLGITLVEIGDNTDPLNDDEIVDRAAVKLKMLYDMLVAAGVHEGILNAAVRG